MRQSVHEFATLLGRFAGRSAVPNQQFGLIHTEVVIEAGFGLVAGGHHHLGAGHAPGAFKGGKRFAAGVRLDG